MSGKNTTDSSTGNASALPPDPVKAAPSGAGGSGSPIAGATPPASTDAPKRKESRSEIRIHVRWHVDIFIDGQIVYHGFVKDISLKGADIFLDHNLQNAKSAKLHIHVPPLHVTDEHHIVEVSGKIIYATHDNDELLFRTGIKFIKFNLDSDSAYLQSRLANH